MIIDQFIEQIRVGVVAGVYDKNVVIDYMTARGWHTTANVPPESRQPMISYLDHVSAVTPVAV